MKFNDDMSPLEALHIALENEKKSYEFYREAACKIQDTGTKKMFEFLAKEEVRHQQMIQDEMDKGFYREM